MFVLSKKEKYVEKVNNKFCRIRIWKNVHKLLKTDYSLKLETLKGEKRQFDFGVFRREVKLNCSKKINFWIIMSPKMKFKQEKNETVNIKIKFWSKRSTYEHVEQKISNTTLLTQHFCSKLWLN